MRVRASADVVWCPVEGELVLFSASAGCYFGLQDVAARIWIRFSEGATPDEVTETLLSEYQVERATARSEVERLLNELTGLRLLVSG